MSFCISIYVLCCENSAAFLMQFASLGISSNLKTAPELRHLYSVCTQSKKREFTPFWVVWRSCNRICNPVLGCQVIWICVDSLSDLITSTWVPFLFLLPSLSILLFNTFDGEGCESVPRVWSLYCLTLSPKQNEV